MNCDQHDERNGRYAGRFDCGCVYELLVQLLGEDDKVCLDQFHFKKRLEAGEGTAWSRVEHTFRGYPVGVRRVRFRHAGQDTQFWAGHYGSKMTAASVRLSFD